jgi:hypothetical protein
VQNPERQWLIDTKKTASGVANAIASSLRNFKDRSREIIKMSSTPNPGFGAISLVFGTDQLREEKTFRKTKVTEAFLNQEENTGSS